MCNLLKATKLVILINFYFYLPVGEMEGKYFDDKN